MFDHEQQSVAVSFKCRFDALFEIAYELSQKISTNLDESVDLRSNFIVYVALCCPELFRSTILLSAWPDSVLSIAEAVVSRCDRGLETASLYQVELQSTLEAIRRLLDEASLRHDIDLTERIASFREIASVVEENAASLVKENRAMRVMAELYECALVNPPAELDRGLVSQFLSSGL